MPRKKLTTKKLVPIRTWALWKPVAKKKIEPKQPQVMEILHSMYSKAWNRVKNTPKRMDRKNPKKYPKKFPIKMECNL